MDRPRPGPPLSLKLVRPFSDELFNELSSSVRGRVLRPTDPGCTFSPYSEHAKTFNGKLKSLSSVLVSPLDARDVSAVVKFCVRHGLSPSVRAGGYGIAGWSVAGDVIIDMSMMTHIDIEQPIIASSDNEPRGIDWTPMAEMVPSRNGDRPEPPAPLPTPRVASGDTDVQRPGKRRREDRSPSAPPEGDASSNGLGDYDNASHVVAAFLRGPPLPPEPGETPRQPPTNRPRHHSPEPDLPNAAQHFPQPSAVAQSDGPGLEMPPLNEDTRQLSGESTSSASSQPSTSRFGSRDSQSSASATTSGASPSDEQPKDSTPADAREPFPYASSSAAPPAHLPMFGATAPGLGVSASAPGGFLSFPNWPMPPPPSGAFAGVAALNPAALGSGFVLPPSGVSGVSPFGLPPPMASAAGGQPLPPLAFGLPPILGVSGMADAARAAQQAGTARHYTPVHPHAYMTFGAGMRQKDIDRYSAEHPLEGTNTVTGEKESAAVPYHVPMSAHPVGSSIMLLAGFGFISRMYGLSIDNVVEIEMVLADGQIVIVNVEKDPELWWAIRGAGPAFGIATRYKARAFPVPVVFAGNLVYRFHRATAPSLIKHFRDCIKGAPRELYANVLLTAGPADKDSLVVIQMCYVGPKEDGMPYLQAISSWDGERCLLNEVNEKSFLNQQDSVAQVLRGKVGRQWFLRSALITTLPDEVINRTVLEFADTPIGCTWLFELAGGAIGDFEDNCLPKEQREATWTVAALHQWDMGIDDPRCITTAEQSTYHLASQWMGGTIKQVAVGGPYPTFLGRHEPPARTMACYGKNWDRLAALKRKYDPGCLFKNNFWPLDAHGRPIESLANEPPSP
ncbi:hypothetical protein C8Q77DRAFT_1076036 [Trametes polyzona]|nr:hypothetical protein C8Q77DRAFT_1076036 [Trametes polyzona]